MNFNLLIFLGIFFYKKSGRLGKIYQKKFLVEKKKWGIKIFLKKLISFL